MHRCTPCASQRKKGAEEKDGVMNKESVKKDTDERR